MFTRLVQRVLPLPSHLATGTARRWWTAPPSECAVCRSWPAEPVCDACVLRFMPSSLCCVHCALALPADLSLGLRSGPALCGACARQRPPLDRTLAAVPYAYPWSTLISAYKFGEQHGWADFFGGLLLRSPGVRDLLSALEPADLIVPMPLSAARLETRGFNQAWTLARALVQRSHTRASPDAGLLLRIRHTRPQSQLKREARLANMRGAFLVEPLRQRDVQGRRVLLVDDVMTSGASLCAAAQALRDGGASGVSALVLARTAVA